MISKTTWSLGIGSSGQMIVVLELQRLRMLRVLARLDCVKRTR
jgi:hypothetical protein